MTVFTSSAAGGRKRASRVLLASNTLEDVYEFNPHRFDVAAFDTDAGAMLGTGSSPTMAAAGGRAALRHGRNGRCHRPVAYLRPRRRRRHDCGQSRRS